MGAAGSGTSRCCNCTLPEERIQLLTQTTAGADAEDGEDPLIASIVQFTCAIYYCTESEEQMLVDIVRFGDASAEASCAYSTQDASARAGFKYTATHGTVVFAPGETLKTVAVPILRDPMWNSTAEFSVVLTRVKGARMGKYLNECRVRIIDDDTFPSSRFAERLRAGGDLDIPGLSLLWEFSKLLMRDRAVRADTLKAIALDQFKGVFFVVNMYLQMYLVDVVLAPVGADEMEAEGRGLLLLGDQVAQRLLGFSEEEAEDMDDMTEGLILPHHRRRTATVIGIIYVLPVVLAHLIDQYKCFLCIPGEARKLLQANLLRAFMNYTDDVRVKLKPSELTMAMVRDVVEVVDRGFMKCLEIIRIVGKVTCALIFILAENRSGVIPLIVYPVVLGLWLFIRERRTIKVTEARAQKQDDLVHCVDDVVHNFALIAGFQFRPTMEDSYERCIDEYHIEEASANSVITNNRYMAPWLTTLFIAGYMILGASTVSTVGGSVSLGTFLATINIFKEVGDGMEEIYEECLEIQISFGPLRKITHLMNMGTDTLQRMAINRKRRKEGREQREQKRRESLRDGTRAQSNEFAVDAVNIAVRDVTFKYGRSAPIIANVSASFEQGKMYAIVGPPREGKATMLKLLGQAVVPEEFSGDIFVPPHLRIAYMTRDRAIMNRSLLENLTLGKTVGKVGGLERVRRICQRLGLSASTLSHLGGEAGGAGAEGSEGSELQSRYPTPWADEFSHTDYARLNLARAFIANPECLICHKPLLDFDDGERTKVLELLREHVDERGIELGADDRRFRRPRTLFFSTTTLAGVKTADHVYEVSREGGMRRICANRASTMMLLS